MSKGRPKLNGNRNFKLEVFQLLPQTGEEINYNDWKKAALEKGIKHTTFLKNVRKLMATNQIIRRVDNKSTPPRTYYKLKDSILEFEKEINTMFYESSREAWDHTFLANINFNEKEYGSLSKDDVLFGIKCELALRLYMTDFLIIAGLAEALTFGSKSLDDELELLLVPRIKDIFTDLKEAEEKCKEYGIDLRILLMELFRKLPPTTEWFGLRKKDLSNHPDANKG